MNKIEKELRENEMYSVGLNGVAVIDNTFWFDFSVADVWGERAIKDTYKRSFNSFKDDIRYMTALAITLNHKAWQQSDKGNKELTKLYTELYEKIDAFILDCVNAGTDKEEFVNFNNEEINYYVRATD